jgi:hypothetical protein
MPHFSERGLTLTELTIVAALATLVMLGMVGFYMNSQSLWMGASSQTITQREASTLVEEIAKRVRASYRAVVSCPDSTVCQLELYDYPDTINASHVYWWDSGDSLVHEGPDHSHDRGPMLTSKVEAFQLERTADYVDIVLLQLRSAEGEQVRMSTRIAFQNRRDFR